MNARVLLYDVAPMDVYFSRDDNWLFTIDHGVKVVYHLQTGSKCIHVGNHWVITPENKSNNTRGEGESVAWPADQADLWRLEDLLQPNRE